MTAHLLRRRWELTEAGETLMVPTDPIETAIDAGLFLELTNLDRHTMVASPLVGLPLPRYDENGHKAFSAETVPAAVLWHPWFWLPTEMAKRRVKDSGELENDDDWAVRIAIESVTVGFYDEETGTWLDAPSLVGVDIGSPAGVATVEAFQRGEQNQLTELGTKLDEITHNEENPDWALAVAQDWMGDSWTIAFNRQSDTLTEYLGDALDAQTDDFVQVLVNVCFCALVGPAGFWHSEDPQWWEDTRFRLASGTVADTVGLAEEMWERLATIRDATQDRFNELAGIGQSVLAEELG